MAKNAKERQKEYRERQRLNSVDRRLNLWINSKAYSALERLTEHFKITKREDDRTIDHHTGFRCNRNKKTRPN